MKLLALVAIALVLPQEKNEAEELFKKLDGKLAQAETVTVEFKTTFEQQRKGREKVSGRLSGTILLQSGGKARLELEGRISSPLSVGIVSDGKTTAFLTKDPGTPKPSAASPTLNRDASLQLARYGGVNVVMETQKNLLIAEGDRRLKEAGRTPEPHESDPLKTLKLSGFKMGPGDKIDGRAVTAIEYVIEEVGDINKSVVTLWIDSETLLPIRRRVTSEGLGILIEETYSVFKLGEKIDAAKFDLPKETK